jgi:hypothetical protein
MDSRAHIAADAIGSVHAEGLKPGATVAEILGLFADVIVVRGPCAGALQVASQAPSAWSRPTCR